MIEYYLRPKFQKFLIDPLVAPLLSFRYITPTLITLLALFSGLLSASLLHSHVIFLAICFLLLSGYFDILDGSLARQKKQASAKGAVLDIVSDRVVEFSLIYGLFSLAPHDRAEGIVLMLGASFICVTSFLVVAIFTTNASEKSFYYSLGLMERAEAFLFFILMMCFPSAFQLLALLYSVLVLLTAGYRLYHFFRY